MDEYYLDKKYFYSEEFIKYEIIANIIYVMMNNEDYKILIYFL